MLLAASLVVLPQLLANHSGRGLELPDPFHGCPGQPAVSTWASFTATVSTAMGGLSYLFFSSLLGNAVFDGSLSTHGWAATGWAHLLGELLLCCLFCVYVYWIWQHNAHALEEIDEDQARARTCSTLLLLRLAYYWPLATDHRPLTTDYQLPPANQGLTYHSPTY